MNLRNASAEFGWGELVQVRPVFLMLFRPLVTEFIEFVAIILLQTHLSQMLRGSSENQQLTARSSL